MLKVVKTVVYPLSANELSTCCGKLKGKICWGRIIRSLVFHARFGATAFGEQCFQILKSLSGLVLSLIHCSRDRGLEGTLFLMQAVKLL